MEDWTGMIWLGSIDDYERRSLMIALAWFIVIVLIALAYNNFKH